MRISDWSSDVCSSDLHVIVTPDEGRDEACARLRREQRLIGAEAKRDVDQRPVVGQPLAGLEPVHRQRQLDGDIGRKRAHDIGLAHRSEEHTSELQSLMRNSYAVFCLKKKKNKE